PGSVRSFDEYTAPLVDLLSALPDGEKVTTVTVYPHPLLVIGCLHACTSFFSSSFWLLHYSFSLRGTKYSFKLYILLRITPSVSFYKPFYDHTYFRLLFIRKPLSMTSNRLMSRTMA
uniref:Uncharacterized protein n=1 Tax=Aegilops tauschii subsp. strangulata TaxID=200361 RepID=A0A453HPD9_AEGTS